MATMAKDQLWRGGRITNHLSRLCHYRGNGIHSPYVYSIVRNVFMNSKLLSSYDVAFKLLRGHSIQIKTAIEIANLAHHCQTGFIGVNAHDGEMVICTRDCSDLAIESLVKHGAEIGTTIVIMSPYKRMMLCNKILKEHQGTSIDRFSYLIIFNNHLPKQHFKL